jgi:mRNA interferase RelE/StbE
LPRESASWTLGRCLDAGQAGVEGYRLRVGDWRAVYTLRRQVLTVVVVRIGHRSEVYE